MESIFFRKDYDAPTEKRVSNTTIQSGMSFAFGSSLFLILSVFLPIIGDNSEFLYKRYTGFGMASLFEFGHQGLVVIAVSVLAFALNYYRKHGWAAICGGTMLSLWLIHFISTSLQTLISFRDIRFGFGLSYWEMMEIDYNRYVRLFGYWVFPVAAAMVIYASLKLRKKEKNK